MQNHTFFPGGVFSKQSLLFQTIESAKRTFAARAGSGKPALLHAFDFSKRPEKSLTDLHLKKDLLSPIHTIVNV